MPTERLDIFTERASTMAGKGWRVSAIVNDHRVSYLFIDYTKREALSLFREHIRDS